MRWDIGYRVGLMVLMVWTSVVFGGVWAGVVVGVAMGLTWWAVAAARKPRNGSVTGPVTRED